MSHSPPVYTIGHSNIPFERFAAALAAHGIELVVDTRSSPFSRFVPWANRNVLTVELGRLGIEYRYDGSRLGGRPGGTPNYPRMARVPQFERAIGDLIDAAVAKRVALLCSEADPLRCHRHLLIGRALLARGQSVCHILSDGRLFEPRAAVLHTIGFAGKSLRAFVHTLRLARVDAVIDVRLRNTSQIAGWSKRDDLAFVLEGYGVFYHHLSDLAPDAELLDGYRSNHDWLAYERRFADLMAERNAYANARPLVESYLHPCLLCSEPTPEQCHRRLVAEAMAALRPGLPVAHLL